MTDRDDLVLSSHRFVCTTGGPECVQSLVSAMNTLI